MQILGPCTNYVKVVERHAMVENKECTLPAKMCLYIKDKWKFGYLHWLCCMFVGTCFCSLIYRCTRVATSDASACSRHCSCARCKKRGKQVGLFSSITAIYTYFIAVDASLFVGHDLYINSSGHTKRLYEYMLCTRLYLVKREREAVNSLLFLPVFPVAPLNLRDMIVYNMSSLKLSRIMDIYSELKRPILPRESNLLCLTHT